VAAVAALAPAATPGAGRGLLRIADVSKDFVSERGVVEALSACSLSIAEGEFVCVVGPSGCGKSTLLRLIGGLTQPSSGQIFLDGIPVARPSARMTFVFQRPVLLPWFSVLGNVLLPIRLAGGRIREAEPKARALLDRVGLRGFEDRFPRELSGGMQQRAALARALVTEPSVLLMDEPFAALDALTREHMAVELQRIISLGSVTTIFITHSIPEAALLGDRVVVLSGRPGHVVEDLRVPLARPRTMEVAKDPAYIEVTTRVRRALEQGSDLAWAGNPPS